ncbi:hypothetical protein OUZ56_026678 [Daphnia magna]|uniref:Uncharacterized protein n=1 Tax=Daphnia magna TaxID=35525 RepID=A0ABQ9ZMW5_9CRUS|nr:hypothetical protein OUZ56_026678 [Daphnia magna]
MSTAARLAVGGSKSGRDLERRLTARGENHDLYIPNEPACDLLLHNQEEDVGQSTPIRQISGAGLKFILWLKQIGKVHEYFGFSTSFYA